MSDPHETQLGADKAFIRANACLCDVPGLDGLKLWLADSDTPLWRMTADDMSQEDVEPPFWAFAWAGGQGLARYIFDHPDCVRGRHVLDVASGSGLVAIAAMQAGAASVTANDIDPMCEAALALNAEQNGVSINWLGNNLLEDPPPDAFDVILAGDVFYEQRMSEAFQRWLAVAARQGATVLAGDPARYFAPERGVEVIAAYDAPTNAAIEFADSMKTRVLRFKPD